MPIGLRSRVDPTTQVKSLDPNGWAAVRGGGRLQTFPNPSDEVPCSFLWPLVPPAQPPNRPQKNNGSKMCQKNLGYNGCLSNCKWWNHGAALKIPLTHLKYIVMPPPPMGHEAGDGPLSQHLKERVSMELSS